MKNNTINEITRIKKLMLINEASIIKWNFGESLQPKIESKLKGMSDANVKSWNIEVKKPNPYRQGVDNIEKIDTKAKLLAELNNLNYDLRNLTQPQKDFLISLNKGMGQIDPKYIDDLVTEFKPSYKSADDATRGEFLEVYKSILTETQAAKFEKDIKGFTIKAGLLPVLKDIIKGSHSFVKPFFSTWPRRILTILGIATPKLLVALYNIIRAAGDRAAETLNKAVDSKGAELFELILENEDMLTNDTPDNIASAYGITEENKIRIDKYAQDFSNTKNFIDTTTGEVEELIKNLTSNFDGVNFIYFLSKFRNISGKKLIGFLFDEGITDINNIIKQKGNVSPEFEFYKKTSIDIQTMKSLKIVLDAITKSYGGVDGYSQMLIKQDSRNENSEWVPFNNSDSGITLNVINSDGETIPFDYKQRTDILNDLKIYIDEVWKTANPSMIEKATNAVNSTIKNEKQLTQDDLLELSLDPTTVYTEVSNELMKKHPEFNRITFTWPWVQKITENVVGLARILKEDPILGPKKKVDKDNNQNTQNVLPPTPFTTKAEGDAFRAWVRQTDAAYATQINLSATGPFNNNIIRNAYKKYGTLYQQSLTSGGGAAQQSETVDKAKEIFDKFNDSVFFYSVNNERMNIEYTQQIGKWIKYFTGKKFNEESAYLGSILSAYGNMISKYKTDETIQSNIDTQLPTLQSYLKTLFEGIQIKRSVGLSQILEQIANLVTVNVINRVPQKQTEDDNYKNASGKIITSVIGGGDEVIRGEKSDTVARIKKALGYTKDNTPYFTDDFDKFIIDYKGKKELDNTNSNISKELICSIEQYKKLCSTSASQKTTAPVKQTQIPIEVKYLNDYATAVGTGTPSEGACKSLFDYYVQQAKNWDLGNKVGQPNTAITAELLTNAKTAVKRCKIGIKKNFYPRDRKYILDKNNPFYIVEFEKEDKTPTTTNATAPKKLTDMSSIELSIMKKNQPLDFKSAYDMLGAIEKKMVDNKSAGK